MKNRLKNINPYYFTDENSKGGLKINPDSHSVKQANSILSVMPIIQSSELKQDIIINSYKNWLLVTLD